MKKGFILSFLLLATLMLSGCLGADENKEIVYSLGTVFKTVDSGAIWDKASRDDSEKTIITPEILALEIDPINSQLLLAGTEKDGLFFSEDGASSWKKLNFPLTRIYGVAISQQDGNVVYASGLLKERGKIYKSLNQGVDWNEIYSEPTSGMVISALAVDPKNQELVYAGNSEGMIIKTTDGGKTWKNIAKAEGPVTGISFDAKDSSTVYFLAFNNNVLRTRNGGEKMEDLMENIESAPSDGEPFFLIADANVSGKIWLGLDNGLLKSSNFGDKFEVLNTIESSRNFPARSLAINPRNSNEIIYNAAQALYKSTDGGEKWTTSQLDISRIGSQIKYDPRSPNIIYLGLRKVD